MRNGKHFSLQKKLADDIAINTIQSESKNKFLSSQKNLIEAFEKTFLIQLIEIALNHVAFNL
jgi:hypothetical protein